MTGQTDRQIDRQTERLTETDAERSRDRLAETDRQTDRQTDSQRQTDKLTETDRQVWTTPYIREHKPIMFSLFLITAVNGTKKMMVNRFLFMIRSGSKMQ